MTIRRMARPASLDEALRLVRAEGGLPIGGGAWLALHSRPVELAVELSGLGLDYVREAPGRVEIGATASLRSLETSALLADRFGSLFSDALAHVAGVQVRNLATAGGSVAGRYGFSDLGAALAALGARVALPGLGEFDLAGFLAAPPAGPFLLERITLPARARAAFRTVRIASADFAVLDAAASWAEGAWRLALGARPGAARLCPRAAAILGGGERPSSEAVEEAARAAALETDFGDDLRASAGYRRRVAAVLARRAVEGASR